MADTLLLQIDYSDALPQTNRSDAEKAVVVALELDKNLAEAWTSSAAIAIAKSQDDRAESMYRRAIELNPNYATARHWYGFMLLNHGRLDEALAQLQRAVELDPLSPVIRQNLGATLAAQGSFPEAEAVYRKAIEIEPLSPGPYMYLAVLYAYNLNRFADAVPLLQKAVELDSGNPGFLGQLAMLYLDLGDDSKFHKLTAQAAKRWPDDFSTQYQSALADLFRLDIAGAVRHAQRAHDKFPRFREVLAILRDADLQSGRYDAALARYEKAYPELFLSTGPRIHGANYGAAIDIALVARKHGDGERVTSLLDGATRVIRTMPRLGIEGQGIAEVQIHALRGQKAQAIAALQRTERVGWRGFSWRYYRDFDPALASIRNESEFKAVFADIERDMARQSAQLTARPKDAPLQVPAITNN